MRVPLLVLTLLAAGCGGEEASELRNESDANPPAVAELVCGDDGPELLTPVVRGRPDGVHIRVRNENDYDVELDYDITRGTTGGGSSVAPPGSSVHVLPFAAEEISLGCAAEALDRVDLQVADRDDELKSADLECDRIESRYVHPPEDIRGRDPVNMARRFLRGRGLRPTDRVEAAVPIAGRLPVVRVARGGRVVAAINFDNARPLHTIGSLATCTDFAD